VRGDALKLGLASLSAVWATALVVAFFWLGFWVTATFDQGASIGYWIWAWALFGAVGAVPFIVYEMVED
jgi:hypothetical protein